MSTLISELSQALFPLSQGKGAENELPLKPSKSSEKAGLFLFRTENGNGFLYYLRTALDEIIININKNRYQFRHVTLKKEGFVRQFNFEFELWRSFLQLVVTRASSVL